MKKDQLRTLTVTLKSMDMEDIISVSAGSGRPKIHITPSDFKQVFKRYAKGPHSFLHNKLSVDLGGVEIMALEERPETKPVLVDNS